jgi:hypothetical protein
VTVAAEATADVLTVNVAVVAPAETVTLAGTVAEPLSLERLTTAPPTAAGLLNVTVPVEDVPPMTLVGLSDTDNNVGAVIVRDAVCVPLNPALIVAVALLFTAVVFTVNVADVPPAATVTLAGTVAEALSLAKVTDAPPVGATPFNVTVPVEEVPPVTVVGLNDTEDSDGALIVSEAVCVPL